MKKPYTVGDLAYDRASAEARTRLYAGERGIAVRLAFRRAIALAPDDVERRQMERLQASLKHGRRFGHKTKARSTDHATPAPTPVKHVPRDPDEALEAVEGALSKLTKENTLAVIRDAESAFDHNDTLPATGGRAPEMEK